MGFLYAFIPPVTKSFISLSTLATIKCVIMQLEFSAQRSTDVVLFIIQYTRSTVKSLQSYNDAFNTYRNNL